MRNKSTEEQLKTLASIRPDPVFLKWSRKAIIAEIETGAVKHRTRLWELLGNSMRNAYAIGGAGVFIITLMLVTVPNAAPRASSLNGDVIATERQTIAAENNIAETRYFKGISPAISLALTDIIEPKDDYGSTNHIKKGLALLDKKD
jgi:hypothetical protein